MNRTPPIEIIRGLRREVGFGCPILGCGNPYLEWHHFSPPWNVRKHHEPEGMIALCAEHHKKADAGAYTEEQLNQFKQQAILNKNKIKGKFDWLRNKLLIIVGGSFFYETNIILEYRREPIIWFQRDEEGYLLLNMKMLTTSGEERAVIEDNIWVCKGAPLDLESPPSGKSLRILYSNEDEIKIKFFELNSKEDIKKKYPDAPSSLFGEAPFEALSISPVQRGIILPITAVEVHYKIGGTGIEFGPDGINIPGIFITNSFMQYSRCAVSFS